MDNLFPSIQEWLEQSWTWLQSSSVSGTWYTSIIRWIMPILALAILATSIRSLLRVKYPAEIWGYVSLPGGVRLPLSHWENTIGRAKSCDVQLNYPTVSRNHGTLIRDDDGNWTITDLSSKTGIWVNGSKIDEPTYVHPGDVINIGGMDLVLIPISQSERSLLLEERTEESRPVFPWGSLLLLTLFQALTAMEFLMAYGDNINPLVPLSFAGLCGGMWCYALCMRAAKRFGFDMEIIVFFLCTLSLAVVSSSAPSSTLKQLIAIFLGIFVFLILGWILRDLERAVKLRHLMALLAIGLFALNLVLAKTVYGARNWVSIGGFQFQPSELIKIAFVFVGSATLDRLFARRNLYGFILFSGFCLGCLALMGDFGTAAIFFVTFLVMAFLRSGDFATLALICGGTVFACFIVLQIKPYIAQRFAVWGHVWENASTTGYQQTRAMSAAASGGLIGVGGGRGWLTNVAASDTDLVFGVLCEEWGLIIALLAICAIVTLGVFAVRSVKAGRSTFYTIAACGATSLLIFQAILNVCGSVDLLPLTGVTFPFVSNGGSSMLSSWGLLAFLKAADTRQNASFAIRLEKNSPRHERIES